MIVGTRGSKLARAQTELFVRAFKENHPGIDIEIRTIATRGDKERDRPLSALGGFGAFVKELDQKIVAGEIDVAVNSLKDMPVKLTPGTSMAAVLPRGPVEDVIIPAIPIQELPPSAVVGTSSVRRRALILNKRRDLVVKDLRGNVPTRLRKLSERQYDTIVIARSGLERLGYGVEHIILDPTDFVPAVGQGVIAAVCREGSEWEEAIRSIDDPTTRLEAEAERFILRELGGGCSVPIGVWATSEGTGLRVRGIVLSEDGTRSTRAEAFVQKAEIPSGLQRIASELREGMEGMS